MGKHTFTESVLARINNTSHLRKINVNPKTDNGSMTLMRNGKKHYISGYIGYDENDQPIFFTEQNLKKYFSEV
jgi:hypothetical protein